MSYIRFKSEKNQRVNAGNVKIFRSTFFTSVVTLNTYNSPDIPSYVHHSDQLVDDTTQ